ncbi:hypothetical protein G6F60_015666 [Rhizopus arrhizus]|nr:hypothetical protein G6F60_015666 [Rhizopus arrhizus]
MDTRISATNDSTASGHMCQISAKPITTLIAANTTPAQVFFGMWIGAYFFGGGGRPRFFASWKASSSSALGTTAKL